MSIHRGNVALACCALLFLGACRSLGAVPGGTTADRLLQSDTINTIKLNARIHGHVFEGEVLDTRLVKVEDGKTFEDWVVVCGGEEVTCSVQYFPDPSGGTFVSVSFPEQHERQTGPR